MLISSDETTRIIMIELHVQFQLLPTSVAKYILRFLPSQLNELIRVNKYWATLIEEVKQEISARHTLKNELNKLQTFVSNHAPPLDIAISNQFDIPSQWSSPILTSLTSFKSLEVKMATLSKPYRVYKRSCKVKDLKERLDKRGAADHTIFRWCKKVVSQVKNKEAVQKLTEQQIEETASTTTIHFPSPLLNEYVTVPLETALTEDPARRAAVSVKNIVRAKDDITSNEKEQEECYQLWSNDFSRLYSAIKIPSYLLPS